MQFTGPIEGLNACIHGTNVYQNMEYNFPWGQRIPGIYPKFRDYNYSINILHGTKLMAYEAVIFDLQLSNALSI